MADSHPDFNGEPRLSQLRQQDHACFASLVACYHNILLTVARSIIGPALADEVVQESWVSAYQSLPKFEGRSSVKTWLITIVSNHAKSRLRKESRTISLDALEELDPGFSDRFRPDGHWSQAPSQWHTESPESLLEEKQLQRCIDQTLAQLPPMQRAVFTLRDLEQLSLAEICNNLGLSDSNVRVLLHRARLKLMQMIDRYQETGQC
jgi:RNA polymerase sigma-70 factor (ECF subfamily)